MTLLPLIACVIISMLSTELVRRHAIRNHRLDQPNHRSSHVTPTPRGGGLAIVVTFLLAIVCLVLTGKLDVNTFLALAGGGVLVAAIGYWDDCQDLSAKTRLLGHLAAAVWAVIWLGGISQLDVGFTAWDWGWLGYGVTILGIVWLLNLYNFMDGIDGIAGSETVIAAGVGGVFLLSAGADGLALTAFVLAAACVGFLLWNWPPAKIFMGDVGSGFLGYVLAVLLIASDHATNVSVWVWLLLLSVFVVDATVTLLRRLLRHEKIYEAHRSHAYQNATTLYSSHLKVTLATIAINLVWLVPLAFAAWQWPDWAALLFVVGILPLVGLALKYHAGTESAVGEPTPQGRGKNAPIATSH